MGDMVLKGLIRQSAETDDRDISLLIILVT